jgi:acyl-CoA dehydrogenase
MRLLEDHPYAFADTHAAVRARAEAFAIRARTGPEAVGTGTIRARVAALGAAGLLREGVARDDTRAIALMRDALAYHDVMDDLALIIQELAGYPLHAAVRAGAHAFGETLEASRAGEKVLCFALTEPGAGSDVRGVATTAVKHGDMYQLTGTKHYVSNAPEADAAVVFARFDNTVACFLVDAPPAETQAVAGHSIGRIVLRDTPARLVAAKGLPLALGALERCRPTVGAAALGMARRAFDETRRHVSTREQFGAPLARLDVVRARVAEMALRIEGAALACAHACWARDNAAPGVRTSYESAVGKVTATESCVEVIDLAVQLHGALGVDEDALLQHLWRAARPLTIYEGATDVLKTVIAARWLPDGESA